jgi:hypothetical protein
MRAKGLKRLALLGAVTCALVFPTGALGAEAACEGDECQGPPPAPQEVIPATAVVKGPENPPVRFPKAQHKKRKGQKRTHKQRQGNRNRQRQGRR